MKSTKDLLKETFASIPHDFSYREVRFYVYQALQRLEKLEKRELAHEKQRQQNENENKKKNSPWMPPIYQDPIVAKQTLDLLNKMIESENKIIESVRSKNKTQQKNGNQNEDGNEQTFYG